MTERPNDFDQFAESIEAAATDTGALIVNTLLDVPERPAVPHVRVALDDMLAVIRHIFLLPDSDEGKLAWTCGSGWTSG